MPMPIHDLGYRGWNGKRTSDLGRWRIIAGSVISASLKSLWVKRILFIAWLPTLVWGVFFFLFEQRMQDALDLDRLPTVLEPEKALLSVPPELVRTLGEDPGGARSEYWSYLILVFFRSTQAAGLAILIGLIAPPLISRDLRSRAFLLYFARPITRLEYLVGKSAGVWFFTAAITTLPALLLFVQAVMLSPDLSVLEETWHIPFCVLAASFVLIIPTTMIALCLSSMTRENRFANFGWFAFWIIGEITYQILLVNHRNWPVVSPYRSLGQIQQWIFGFEETLIHMPACVAFWVVLTCLAFVVLYRRISAPMRV
jgi:hypothetical protein